MQGMSCGWMWSTGNYSVTQSFDFPPTFTLATISISKFAGDGTGRAGILSFRTRNADGSDQTTVLAGSGAGDAPALFSSDRVTNVVFELWTHDAFAYAVPMVTFW
jgi:hypothetical protein